MNTVHNPLRSQTDLDAALEAALTLPDERALDSTWTEAFRDVAAFVTRPAKRVRPTLVMLGYGLAKPGQAAPAGVSQFAAGLELLHAFMLVHDDVADAATTRRGGPALHHVFAKNGAAPRQAEQLAVLAGDHLYARALEVMLSAELPKAADATRWLLQVCRHTAVGQYLDLTLSRRPLSEVSLFETMRVAQLKTARYGFIAPLVCGAMLGDGSPELIAALTRVGRHAGTAFQLRDDLIGLFGDDAVAGKQGASDFLESKRTFPVLAAWTRADDAGRDELERLWSGADVSAAACARARELVTQWGGLAATDRVIDRSTKWALKALQGLPRVPAAVALDNLFTSLARRAA